MRRFRRLLFATDFSSPAEHAAKRIATLPLAEGATVHLVHVVPPGPAAAKRFVSAEARKRLREAARAVSDGAGVKTTETLAEGEPFVEVIRRARRARCELVVLGRHSKRGTDWGLGTTAQRVVRKGSTPVLVVHPSPVRAYARPVVAVDGSDVSRTIIELARSVVDSRIPLRLVHAYQLPFASFMTTSMPRESLDAFRAEYRDGARRAVVRLLDDVGEAAAHWTSTVREGDPRIVVLRELEERRADLAVLGTHGRTGLAHFLLGSVAEWVLENAPCDVLVGRPERFTFELP
jgi:nucleotide-binding universal stress UspA family protein